MTRKWTYAEAKDLLNKTQHAFKQAYLIPQIVGGVLTNGYSTNDLDIRLEPIQTMTLEDGIALLEKEIFPPMKIQKACYINPAANPANGWCIGAFTTDNQLIEFYFPQDAFPES